jgi:ABC-type transporter Mla MlaB component
MVLQLPQSLTISEVAAYRDTLRRALAEGGLELDARGLQEIDAAGLQLLESAHRTALASGTMLRFTPGGRAALEPAALGLGLRLATDPTLWRAAEPPGAKPWR